jgi:iron complex outermembrane receptor protein
LKIPGYRIVNLNLHYAKDVPNSFITKVDAYFEVRNVFNNTYVASANNVGDSLNATTGAENPGSVLAAGNGSNSGTLYAGFPRVFVGGVRVRF